MHLRISYPDGYSENVAVELRGFKLNDYVDKTSTPGIHIPNPPARIFDLDEVLETLINEDKYPLKGTLSRNRLVQDGRDFDFKYELVGSYEQESERMLLKWAKIFGPGFDPVYEPEVSYGDDPLVRTYLEERNCWMTFVKDPTAVIARSRGNGATTADVAPAAVAPAATVRPVEAEAATNGAPAAPTAPASPSRLQWSGRVARDHAGSGFKRRGVVEASPAGDPAPERPAERTALLTRLFGEDAGASVPAGDFTGTAAEGLRAAIQSRMTPRGPGLRASEVVRALREDGAAVVGIVSVAGRELYRSARTLDQASPKPDASSDEDHDAVGPRP